jgi:hypothetical protein
MTPIGMPDGSRQRTQVIYARLAGFLFLWLIITGLAGAITTSRIAGSGTFSDMAKRVVASEHLYRAALSSELIETMSALLLAFALYATLRPVDKLLAQLAMYWRVGESLIGCVGITAGFVKLRLYTSYSQGAFGNDQARALLDLAGKAGSATVIIGSLFFSIGSLLFFCVFLKSRYIPTILSAFGVFASVVVTIMCFGNLIFPEYSGRLLYGWAPMAVAEVTTGFWLMFGVKIPATRDRQPAEPMAIGA